MSMAGFFPCSVLALHAFVEPASSVAGAVQGRVKERVNVSLILPLCGIFPRVEHAGGDRLP